MTQVLPLSTIVEIIGCNKDNAYSIIRKKNFKDIPIREAHKPEIYTLRKCDVTHHYLIEEIDFVFLECLITLRKQLNTDALLEVTKFLNNNRLELSKIIKKEGFFNIMITFNPGECVVTIPGDCSKINCRFFVIYQLETKERYKFS